MSELEFNLSKIQNLNFEEAINELEKIVKIIESGKIGLEKLVGIYEYANSLKNHCAKKLDEAKLKIETINKNSLGDEIKKDFEEA